MAHVCPECGANCQCDDTDIFLEDYDECIHCVIDPPEDDDEDDGEDYDEDDDDE